MATTKKTVKKMQTGGSLKPTYKNLGLARSASNNAAGRDTNTPATKKDSLDYKKGFDMGKSGVKPSSLRAKYEGKNQYEEKGRWEGQNSKKKTGGVIKKAKSGGSFPDLNKDGKITKADILKGRGVIAKKGATVKKAFLGSLLGGGAGKSMLGGMGKQMLGGLAGKALGGLMGKNGKSVKKAQRGMPLPSRTTDTITTTNPRKGFTSNTQPVNAAGEVTTGMANPYKTTSNNTTSKPKLSAGFKNGGKMKKAKSGTSMKKCKNGCK